MNFKKLLFSTETLRTNLGKNALGYILGDFFTNVSKPETDVI
jgi:hypothetical protein